MPKIKPGFFPYVYVNLEFNKKSQIVATNRLFVSGCVPALRIPAEIKQKKSSQSEWNSNYQHKKSPSVYRKWNWMKKIETNEQKNEWKI